MKTLTDMGFNKISLNNTLYDKYEGDLELILNKKIIGRGFFRSVFFFPVLLSPVVVGLIWQWILLKNGAFNAIIESYGGDKVSFLTDPSWAMASVIFVSIWAHMGFYEPLWAHMIFF